MRITDHQVSGIIYPTNVTAVYPNPLLASYVAPIMHLLNQKIQSPPQPQCPRPPATSSTSRLSASGEHREPRPCYPVLSQHCQRPCASLDQIRAWELADFIVYQDQSSLGAIPAMTSIADPDKSDKAPLWLYLMEKEARDPSNFMYEKRERERSFPSLPFWHVPGSNSRE